MGAPLKWGPCANGSYGSMDNTALIWGMHCCHYCVQTDIGKIQTQFRPKKYWNSDQIQTDFDHFQQKFRPTVTRQRDVLRLR